MLELLHKSALDLGAMVRRGDVSSVELTRLFLDRIERHDGELNAFVTVLRRRALLAARMADRRTRRAKPHQLGIFHGVPIGIKDLVPMRGTPTKMGSSAYRWFVSPIDVPAARRIKASGAVILGKLATSEFGVLPITEPDIHPPTRNPWNRDHTPGGSSGGSGAAVAAGLIPLAQGSDGGGSVRIPAAFNHLFGFKPSLSLLGNLHGGVNRLGLSTMGPLAHSVGDGAALLDVLRGHPDGHLERGGDFCLANSRRSPGRLRVVMSTACPLGGEVVAPIAAAVEATGRALESLGHHVEEVAAVNGEVAEFLPLWQQQLAAVPLLFGGESRLQPVTRWLRREGRGLDPDAVERARVSLRDKVEAFVGDADVVLTPTVGRFPPRVGEFDGLSPEEMFHAVAPVGAFTAIFNVTQGPAANIPAGVTAEGLPYGVQLAAHVGRDGVLLGLSRQLEEAMPWRDRRAPGYY
jgi:amidase